MAAFIIIVYLIVVAILAYVVDDFKKKSANRISSDVFDKMLIINQYDALWNKREVYLKLFENSKEYLVLKKFYELFGNLINDYKREILHTPLKLTKPVNSYTAAYIGTKIGGAAVGMIAAQNAIEKEKAYQKNAIDVIVAELKTGNAYDKVEYCYQSIVNILSENEYANSDWNKEKQLIKDEMMKKYNMKNR